MSWHQEEAKRFRRDEFKKHIRDRINRVSQSEDYPGLSREDLLHYGRVAMGFYQHDDSELKMAIKIYGDSDEVRKRVDEEDERFQRKSLLAFAGKTDGEVAEHSVKTAFGLRPGQRYKSGPEMKFPDYIQRAITSEAARTGNYALVEPEEWNDIVAYTFLEEDSPDEGIQNLPEAPEEDVLAYFINNAASGIVWRQAGGNLFADPEKIAAIYWANLNGVKLVKEDQKGDEHE